MYCIVWKIGDNLHASQHKMERFMCTAMGHEYTTVFSKSNQINPSPHNTIPGNYLTPVLRNCNDELSRQSKPERNLGRYQAWWHTPVISALVKQTQFKTYLGKNLEPARTILQEPVF